MVFYEPDRRDRALLPHDPFEAFIGAAPDRVGGDPRPRRGDQPRALQLLRRGLRPPAELPRGESEFAAAGLEMAPSELVKPPRVATARVALECKVTQTVELADVHGAPAANVVVFGQVVGVHVDPAAIVDGRVDLTLLSPVARCGYKGDYTVVRELFEMVRPD